MIIGLFFFNLGDPLDNRYLYLKQSAEFPIAGEGSHARVAVPAHTTYALYNGYQWDKETSEKNIERIRKEFEDRNITDDLHPEKIAAWKYRYRNVIRQIC